MKTASQKDPKDLLREAIDLYQSGNNLNLAVDNCLAILAEGEIQDFSCPPDERSLWTPDISAEQANKLMARELMVSLRRSDYWNVFAFKHMKSMLHVEVLILLRYLAAVTQGALVEFGPYIGGSTVMFAKGIAPPRKLITVELGGSLDNPLLPSEDIHADLEQTLRSKGVAERVILIKAASWDKQVLAALEECLGGQKIGLWCIDSDGGVEGDINMYRHLCAPGCILVIDDILDSPHQDKSLRIRPYVTKCVAEGSFVQFGTFGYGTWIGRFAA